MFQFFQQLLGPKSKPRRKPPRPTGRRFRPSGEALEDRTLMALVGPLLHINSTTFNAQLMPDTASQPASFGRSVTAWVHEYSSSDYDVKAQIYDSSGNKIGGEITVANSPRIEGDPSVAMDGKGNFVVAWTDEVSSGNNDIKARRFSSSGAPLTGVISVDRSPTYQSEPSVATDDFGNFVVSYTSDYSPTDRDVLAQRFNSSGAYLGTVYVATSSYNEHDSSAAMTANGRFAIAFQYDIRTAEGGVDSDIRLDRYSAGGAYLGRSYVATTTRQERNPDVAMDRDGNAVVVYEYQYSTSDWDILSRKISQAGTMGPIRTVAGSSQIEHAPTVAMDLTPGEGDFVVAYAVPQGGSVVSIFPPQRVFVREMSATGGVRATHDLGLQSSFATPSIAINGSDYWFVSYASGDRSDDRYGGIYGRRGYLA